MKTFLCKTCNKKFEAVGVKIDWNDPTFGPSSKFTASCPCNGEECDEYRPLSHKKEELVSSGSSCGSGGCGCGK